ncbi:uncharacterized protein LOC135479371 [Liolophura sinensis]|uniref:uncharacterized protein LOC135479371 n=1 Tax=Liolophura sinensis TaxID=3198878 RepID=UPI0031590BF7
MMETTYQETPSEPLENSKNSEISVENTDNVSDVKNDGLSEISDNQKQNHEQQESLVLNQDVSMATENMEVDRCSDELRTEEREESETYGDKKDNTSDNTEDVNDDNKSDGVLNPEMYVESTVEYDVSKPPVQICGAWAEFSQTDNFLRGCKWQWLFPPSSLGHQMAVA